MKNWRRTLLILAGIGNLILAAGYAFQMPWALATWPWADGRLSYIFVASILAAIGAAILWIGLSGEWESLAAGALNLVIMLGGIAIFFGQLAWQTGEPRFLAYAVIGGLIALFNMLLFLRARRLPARERQRTPRPVMVSFVLFTVILLFVGISLILQRPNIMPWPLKTESSVIFGWIFFGDAFYFLYALLKPYWPFARAQLWSFLAYDLVLIGPLLAHLDTVSPALRPNLLIYIAILLYSGALAVYFLFIHSSTRHWRAATTLVLPER